MCRAGLAWAAKPHGGTSSFMAMTCASARASLGSASSADCKVLSALLFTFGNNRSESLTLPVWN
jgi:hypothetical protein